MACQPLAGPTAGGCRVRATPWKVLKLGPDHADNQHMSDLSRLLDDVYRTAPAATEPAWSPPPSPFEEAFGTWPAADEATDDLAVPVDDESGFDDLPVTFTHQPTMREELRHAPALDDEVAEALSRLNLAVQHVTVPEPAPAPVALAATPPNVLDEVAVAVPVQDLPAAADEPELLAEPEPEAEPELEPEPVVLEATRADLVWSMTDDDILPGRKRRRRLRLSRRH
jgi:hypothetical protein